MIKLVLYSRMKHVNGCFIDYAFERVRRKSAQAYRQATQDGPGYEESFLHLSRIFLKFSSVRYCVLK